MIRKLNQGFPIFVRVRAAPALNMAVEITDYNYRFPSRYRFTHVCVEVLIEVICWFPFARRVSFNDEGIVVDHSNNSTVDARVRRCQVIALDVASRLFK